MAHSNTQNFQKQTFVFKKVGSLELSLDVVTKTSATPSAALIHYHGGFLVFGGKDVWTPEWLLKAAVRRNWAFVSPSYRLVPEATGEEVLSDALSAAQWVSENITKKVIIAGSSAGGFLAIATAAQLANPRPLAVLSVYGMNDLSQPRYVTPGSPLKLGPPATGLDLVVKQISDLKSEEAIDEYDTGFDFSKNKRLPFVAAMHQAAIYPDVLTGDQGLAARIREIGPSAIPRHHAKLFPIATGLPADFPPTALVHGTEDSAVDVSQSEVAAEAVQKLGVEVLLQRVEGQSHGFDLRETSGKDIEAPEADKTPVTEALNSIITFLSRFAD
ncbi:hypothetical protein FOXYS1_848 [Fusarium oxysporum]|uniref:Alpha/beta hydrolase fold-3 domain-containing protein n=1 Tax=Fusarium oxysporum TaxID=5507 RepID=A0A8H5ANZ7_FUSOX|nr:hypothetical protein FOXYS1_848 [Fusarium oxysporum]